MIIKLFNYELVTSSIETVNTGTEKAPELATRFTIIINLFPSTAPDKIFQDRMYLYFLELAGLTAMQIREKITDVVYLEAEINTYITKTYNHEN